MNGHKFEYKCAKMLRRKGFHHVEVTRKSGDQGVDILAYKGFSKYAIQCKYYSYPVGNKAVQEVYAGGKYYDCDHYIVMTNGTFTKAAISAANKLDVKLWSNCSLLKSTSPAFEIMRAMSILGILFGCYLLRNNFPFPLKNIPYYYRELSIITAGLLGWLGWGNWTLSSLTGILYLGLGFLVPAGTIAEQLPDINGINPVFLIPALLYFVHAWFLRPKA